MPGFLYQWSLWLVLTLFIVLLVGPAEIALALVQRRRSRTSRQEDLSDHFVGVMVHSMFVLYGLISALMAINVYETYSEVRRTVSREAAAISALYRDSAGYQEPTRSQIQGSIRDYIQQIIHEAWPQQRRGEIPAGGVALVTRLQERLFAFEPATEGQKIIHAETLRAFNEMAVARRLRVDANREHLPGMMWTVLIFGALFCLFGACLFHVESRSLHATSLGLLGVLIAVVLFLTFVWDRPYLGEAGIDPGTYELVYEQLMRPE
jgi:hypothetical protein